MPVGVPTEEPFAPGRLDDRVLHYLSERSGTIPFNGLRRALGAHPESLSRALRRLEREGSVVRGSDGYSLTVPGPDPGPFPERRSARSVATLELPPRVDRETLFGALVGRWIGSLRWGGVYDRPGDPWLAWSLEGTPGHVLLSVNGRTLTLSIDLPHDHPDAERLEQASTELLLRTLEQMRSRASGSAPALFERPDDEGTVRELWDPTVGCGVGVDMVAPLGRSAS